MKKHIESKHLDIIVRKSMEFKQKYDFSDVEFVGVTCILLQLYGAIIIGGIYLAIRAIIEFFL